MKSLDDLLDILGSDHEWFAWWDGCRSELIQASGDDTESRHTILRKMESAFGGMGSFNDYPHSTEVFDASKKLAGDIAQELQRTWKELGREHHTDDEFSHFQPGEEVHLVKGSILLLDREGCPHEVDFVEDHIYVVDESVGNDITNMPMYKISHKRTVRIARHTSLRPHTR